MSSDGSLTDEGKRRREGNSGETYELFKRSKKIIRTPDRKREEKEDNENKLDQIMKTLLNLATDVKDIKNEQRTYSEEIKLLREENKKMMEENEKIIKENKEFKKELQEINARLEQVEKQSKKDNVVVSGVTMNTYDKDRIKEKIKNLFKQHLQVDIEIKSAKRLGEKTCLVELNNTEDKLKVMKCKSKLRNISTDRIYINDDLTVNERKIRSKIEERAKRAREEGKTVKVGFRKITIEGKIWRWNKSKEGLEETEH